MRKSCDRKARNMHQVQAQSDVNSDKFRLPSMEFNPGQELPS